MSAVSANWSKPEILLTLVLLTSEEVLPLIVFNATVASKATPPPPVLAAIPAVTEISRKIWLAFALTTKPVLVTLLPVVLWVPLSRNIFSATSAPSTGFVVELLPTLLVGASLEIA